ncbi:thioredoxin-like protein [Russula ochroleuca]|uniref:Thioredoxin n=1 Tax=Russula ochroleuca TaxID=152965 RepID=A0A9P5T9W8_9AGAM|nr:thioredoxin-like protein [Russula ochroleuca]
MSADRLDWGESYKTSGVVQIKSFYLQSSSVYPSINMTVTPINSHSDFQNIIKSGRVVVVDFWATWCGPCRVISPVFEKLSNNNYSGVEFYKVDVDEQSDISQEVGIRAMPTFAIFKDGQKVNELVGANPAGLETLISQAVTLV